MRLLAPLLLICAPAAAQTWTQLPDFPGSARDDAASFTIGTRIYVGTGMDAGFQLTNDWWSFDMETEQWTSIASMPATPRQYCTGFTVVDTGYVFGGVDANSPLDQLWAYHPELDSWEQKASIPAEARWACVAVTGYYTNAIVATGMLASGAPTNEAWKYHADIDSWEAIAPVPGPARHRAACFLDGGGMLIAGGADSTFTALSDVWSYPIWFETGQWNPQTPLPAPRFGADGSWGITAALVGGTTGNTPDLVEATAWRYNFSAWPSLPDFPPGPRRGGAASAGTGSAWTSTLYYGTGSDNTVRYHDWWKLDFGVGLMEPSAAGRIELYPNPADAVLSFRTYPSDARTVDLSVFDLSGRILLQKRIKAVTNTVNVSTLANGGYVLKVQNASKVWCARFVIQR